jgi:hypothetical protein
MSLNTRVDLQLPQFAERWIAGTYLVSGTFFLDGQGLTADRLIHDFEPLYQEIRDQKKGWWPRGLAGIYVIPIYCAPAFSNEVMRAVRKRLPYRWAIWPEPVLYRTSDNAFATREDYGHHGSAFLPYLDQLFRDGLTQAATHYGYEIMPNRMLIN